MKSPMLDSVCTFFGYKERLSSFRFLNGFRLLKISFENRFRRVLDVVRGEEDDAFQGNLAEMALIAVGDKIPDGNLAYFDEEDQMQQVSIHSLAAGKKVVFFGVPGAFTPTCSMKHVPGFIEKSDELKTKGVEELLLISVNDPFVMKAWKKSYPETDAFQVLDVVRGEEDDEYLL